MVCRSWGPALITVPPGGIYARVNDRGVRYWKLQRTKNKVETGSAASLEKIKLRTKVCPDEATAIQHEQKTRVKKLREGFVFLRDPNKAKAGEVLYRAALPHAQMHDFLDVHPETNRLLIASEQRPKNENAWLHEVDLRAATIRELHHDDGAWTSARQTFAHRALYLGPERALFSVNGRTWMIDRGSGGVGMAASYQDTSSDAHFNPHCVWPSRDAAYERALVFDKGDVLRVIDRAGETMFQTSLSSKTCECRAAALSPSSALVAAYVVSRGIVYNHDDAKGDTTNEVRIFAVTTGEQLYTIPLPFEISKVGLTPDDQQLIATREYSQGPVFFDLKSGRQTHFFDNPHRDDRWATCIAWAYSADGSTLALSGDGLKLLDARSLKTIRTLQVDGGRFGAPRQVVFSSDGTVLFTALMGGEVVGLKL